MSERPGRFEPLDEAAARSVRRWQAPRLGPESPVRALPVRHAAPTPNVSPAPDGGRVPAPSALAPGPASPSVATPSPDAPGSGGATPTAPDEGRLQRRFDEGRACGIAEGAAAARQAALAESATLLGTLTRAVERHDTLLEDELLALARAMARLIVRRELEHDVGMMRGVVREALERLPRTAAPPEVRLHPLDAAAVRALMTPEEAAPLVADDTLERGDCRIESGASVVDAGIDAWVGRIASRHGVLAPLERLSKPDDERAADGGREAGAELGSGDGRETGETGETGETDETDEASQAGEGVRADGAQGLPA